MSYAFKPSLSFEIDNVLNDAKTLKTPIDGGTGPQYSRFSGCTRLPNTYAFLLLCNVANPPEELRKVRWLNSISEYLKQMSNACTNHLVGCSWLLAASHLRSSTFDWDCFH